MPDNKDDPKNAPQSATGNDPEGKSGVGSGQQAGDSTKGNKCTVDDDDITAGGREGQFSEKDRGSDRPWSPGSTLSSEE